MLLALLTGAIASLPSAPTLVADVPLLATLDSDGSVLVVGDLHAGDWLVLPALSESERVVRALPQRGELRVAIASGSRALRIDGVELRLVRHAQDARVAVTPPGELELVTTSVPPRRVVAADGDVAFVVRQDGNGLGAGVCSLVPPEDLPPGAVLVLTGAERELSSPPSTVSIEGQRLELPDPAGGHVLVVRSGSSRPLALELSAGARLDRAEYARLERLEPAGAPRLELLRTAGGACSADHLERRLGAGPERPVLAWRDPPEPRGTSFPLELPAGELLELVHRAPTADVDAPAAWTVVVRVLAEPHGPPSPSAARPAAMDAGARPRGVRFVDAGASAGVASVHLEGPAQQVDIRPTMGPGAAWGDVDGDGWPDLYLVQGAGTGGTDPLPNRLFHNEGNGRFEDVTERSGAGDTGAGMGALFFDADGDGDLDLYVANYGADALYTNDGSGRFEPLAGFDGGDRWSASVCASDVDRDGDLDLYVTSYLEFDLAAIPDAEALGRYQREDPVPMLPFAFPGQANRFLRNEGGREGLRFADATDELGLADAQGRGMQAVFWDFDRDGDDDLYVANDVSFNVLFRNEGDGTFADVSFSTGLDDPRGGMGLAVGDVDEDGDEDLFLTNWQLEANALYINGARSTSVKRRRSTFHDGTVAAGLGPAGIGVTSWGTELFDADDDGDLDLFVANGYTSPDYESTGICVGQPNHFFEGDGHGRFEDRSDRAGEALGVALASRAAVACDYDRDGRVDVVVTSNNGRVQLLRNETPGAGHWLGLALRARGANPFAIGAEVTVRAGDRTWQRSLRAGSGYLGGNAPELHFGLGNAERIDEVVIRWPSGRTTRHAGPRLDSFARIDEPE